MENQLNSPCDSVDHEPDFKSETEVPAKPQQQSCETARQEGEQDAERGVLPLPAAHYVGGAYRVFSVVGERFAAPVHSTAVSEKMMHAHF